MILASLYRHGRPAVPSRRTASATGVIMAKPPETSVMPKLEMNVMPRSVQASKIAIGTGAAPQRIMRIEDRSREVNSGCRISASAIVGTATMKVMPCASISSSVRPASNPRSR